MLIMHIIFILKEIKVSIMPMLYSVCTGEPYKSSSKFPVHAIFI